ncbi:MAG: hypothetical protein ACLQBY_15370 [Solirubrobacteraceae bacterium]
MSERAFGATQPRRVLHGKAKQAAGLAEKLAHGLAVPHPNVGEVAKLVNDLHPLLASLRQSTLEKNGAHAKLVASGIADLTAAFQKLAQSKQASNPEVALHLLVEGKRALDSATSKAHEAGDAWPL